MDGDVSPSVSYTTDLNRLRAFLDSIGSASEDMILWLPTIPNLSHYTNLDGVLGILTNDDLWLTHTRYCNDEAEMTHGLRIARNVIEEEQGKAGDTKRVEYLSALSKLLQSNEVDPVYVCCFCEQPDLLSQWRAYGANATGVSLEFQPPAFAYITGPDCPPVFGLMRFWRVFYKEDTQRKIIRSAVNYYPHFESGASPEEWVRWTWDAIRFFLPTFKHSDFFEENEWRLIFTPAPGCPAKLSYRAARGMLIPYYSLRKLSEQIGLKAQKLPLTRVRIGPNPNKTLNLASLKMLLETSGYGHVLCVGSNMPYRG
jgi:hypothetical protein